jgi:uncharacterized protein YggE
MSKPLALLLLSAAFAAAQTPPNSITVTASREVTVQPDQVVFAIDVSTGLSANRDEVIGALRGAGITASFSGVRSVQQYLPRGGQAETSLYWSLTYSDALSNLKAAIDALSAAQKSIAQTKIGFAMTFGIRNTEVSPKAQQAQACSMADLIADARAQAQKLAAVAATGAGQILAISGATSGPEPGIASGFAPPTFSPACSLTVKFALGTL